ncbi:AAA family ATPase [Streptomyces sp. NPDC002766]|uniref:ATP-binding protein n=1 Tax=Streptomyces sp. NPDC002766 TaxID=3154429 RepID=UPI00332C2743
MAAEYPFVGREGVLGELRAALESAAAGRGGLVTLAGPAGAGKTRTAEEAAAHAEGFRTLWTWCPPQTVGRAFRPWSRLLRELVADDVACGRLVAASPPLRALVAGAGPGALRGADPEAARLRLTADVAELLATAARRRPLLVVLDDAHAADASSLRLLLETADTARTMPLLLVATARDEEAAWREGGGGGGPGRDRVRAQLLRRGRVSVLGPLPERDVAVLVEAVTGAVPESEAVRSLVRRTGGDAFFVTELLRNGSWSGEAADGEGAGVFPGAVRAAVGERLADLTPRAARLLDVAAVLGTRFRLDVLAEAAEVPLAEVRSLLGEAAGAGLLAEVGAHRAGFRHDLLRDAVYDVLAPADRAALHHTAAEVLAGYARRGRDTGPAEVAHHLFLAGPEHAADAARYACAAATRAEALFAFEDAARWYERAVDAWTDGNGDAGEEPAAIASRGRVEQARADSPDRAELVEMLLGLGAARLGAGEREAARGALLRAAGLAREVGRPDLLARAALGLGTGPVGFEVDLDDRPQVDLLTEARAALTNNSSPPAAPFTALRAAVTARLSLAVGLVESVGRRLALAEEAVRTAREAGDPATLAAALAALCDARPGPDHCHDRLAWSERIIETARDLRDPALELLGRRLRSVALMETGAFAEADAEAAAYETVVRPLRRPLYAWYVPLWRGTRALMEGRYEDCATALDEVERLGRRAGSANAGLLAVTQRWCLYAETGDRAGLLSVRAEAAVLERSPLLWPRVTLALLAAQSGRPEEAARRLSAVAPRLGGAPRDSEWLPMVAQAAETVAAVGSHPAAPVLYDLLAPYAGLFVVEGIGAAVRGPVDRHLALLAAAMGDPDRARAHRTEALRAAGAAGAVALVDRITHETSQPPAATIPTVPDTALFHHEGPLWHLRYAGREVRVPDGKGLHDLAVLLSRPGTPVPAVELASPGPGGPGDGDATGLHPQGDTGEAVDAVARAAYRRRLRELEEDARDADATGDAERSERIAVERDALVGQLAAAYGIGGRVRRTGSPAERARTAVTARIRAAVERVAAVHPELGRHLRTAVRTGTLCVYQPEQPPEWRL